jgi:hypothetical protein
VRLQPVEMTKFDADGNCFEACIASLLGVSPDDVPHQPPGVQEDYHEIVNGWLKDHGYQALTLPISEFDPSRAHFWFPDVYGIAHVEINPAWDWWHAVAEFRYRKVEWDVRPAPRRETDARAYEVFHEGEYIGEVFSFREESWRQLPSGVRYGLRGRPKYWSPRTAPHVRAPRCRSRQEAAEKLLDLRADEARND